MDINPGIHILIVDDMPAMRSILKSLLKKLDFKNIHEAEDGHKAWEFLEGNKVHLVISDWNMPNMKGIDLLKKCRADKRFEDLPFMIVTTIGEKRNVIDAVQAGVSSYIIKPFDENKLREKIVSAFKKKGV